MSFTVVLLEPTSYEHALQFQEHLFNAQLQHKEKGKSTNNHLILLEHLPVYTLGKSGNESNLKVPIEQTGATFHKTNRGGDITFHGPGQLVIYPIFDYERFNLSTKEYVFKLEECIINVLKSYNLHGDRIAENSGIWLDASTSKARKICAIGLKVSKHVSMHGLALNVNTDLDFFKNIIPCGIEDKGVTSMQVELGGEQSLDEVKMKLIQEFERQFK